MAAPFQDKITAGMWKGRGLVLPRHDAVRPSKQRVRMAVFNLLGSRMELRDCRVVDLCCGSGAWGLEAASRGAARVTLVDVDTVVARGNVAALGAAHVDVVQADAALWLPQAPLDVVLADPPYATGLAHKLLVRAQVLGKHGSWWVVETHASEQLDWHGFDHVVRRKYGNSVLWVARQVVA